MFEFATKVAWLNFEFKLLAMFGQYKFCKTYIVYQVLGALVGAVVRERLVPAHTVGASTALIHCVQGGGVVQWRSTHLVYNFIK
jgi:membrane associated rhomboid family serine protease